MTFIYLIFGHLAADFILQPSELVKWKYKNWRGTAFHSFIHFLFYLTVFFAYLPDPKVIAVLAGLAVSHFIIDNCKIQKETRSKNFVKTFFIDQFFHLLTLLAAGWLLLDSQARFLGNEIFRSLYSDFYVVFSLCLLILVSYAVEAAKFQFIRKTIGEAKYKPNYRNMAKRILVFSIIYAIILIFCVYRTAALN